MVKCHWTMLSFHYKKKQTKKQRVSSIAYTAFDFFNFQFNMVHLHSLFNKRMLQFIFKASVPRNACKLISAGLLGWLKTKVENSAAQSTLTQKLLPRYQCSGGTIQYQHQMVKISYYPLKKYEESEFFFSVCCPSVMSLKPLFGWSQLQLSCKFTTVGI